MGRVRDAPNGCIVCMWYSMCVREESAHIGVLPATSCAKARETGKLSTILLQTLKHPRLLCERYRNLVGMLWFDGKEQHIVPSLKINRVYKYQIRLVLVI